MANILTVAYVYEDGATFNEEYYTSRHMPLCYASWQQYGLESCSVTTYHSGPNGAEPHYRASCDLVFRDESSLQESLRSSETMDIIQDVPNFTTLEPVYLYGRKIASFPGTA